MAKMKINGRPVLVVEEAAKPATSPETTIRDIYKTPPDQAVVTGMAICAGRDDATGIFGVAVFNNLEGVNAFALFEADELLRLRDAITKELAQ